MIFSSVLARIPPGLSPIYQDGGIWGGWSSSAGKTVSVETAKNVATAYRCMNVLSDDVAKIPLYTYSQPKRFQIDRVMPDAKTQNIVWLLEVSPNRYMSPFIFKKALIQWLLGWGNAYMWMPPPSGGNRREMFLLRGDNTVPYYDGKGNLWYRTVFNNNEIAYMPDVEVLPLLINSLDGIFGRSVVEYARESIGRQLGAYETQGKMYAQGLNPAGILWANGKLNEKAKRLQGQLLIMSSTLDKKLCLDKKSGDHYRRSPLYCAFYATGISGVVRLGICSESSCSCNSCTIGAVASVSGITETNVSFG